MEFTFVMRDGMTGIEIVNTIVIGGQICWPILLATILGIILFIVGLSSDELTSAAMGIVAIVASLLLFGISAVEAKNEPTIQYQIVIDETVKAQDLLEKYKIIKIDGKIITVELKDD